MMCEDGRSSAITTVVVKWEQMTCFISGDYINTIFITFDTRVIKQRKKTELNIDVQPAENCERKKRKRRKT